MRSLWRPVLDRIVPYDAGRPLEALERELGVEALVRLSANESPLGPSPRAMAAIRQEASRAHLYPDGGSLALRRALAARLAISAEGVIVGNGADELLSLIATAAFEGGDEVVMTRPAFEPYSTVARLAGASIVESPLVEYETDLDDVRRRLSPRTKAVFICSPHNPATTIVRRGPLAALLGALGGDGPLVVLDEAYGDFCDDPEYPDGVKLLASYPRLLVLRTFSKIAGLAGLRVGYAIGEAETIDRLNRVRAPYNVNRLGQVAALAALEDQEHLARTRAVVLEERAFLSRELGHRGYRFPASQANFLLLRVADTDAARARLLSAGLIVRDGGGIGFPGHLRIAISTREVNLRLLAALDARS